MRPVYRFVPNRNQVDSMSSNWKNSQITRMDYKKNSITTNNFFFIEVLPCKCLDESVISSLHMPWLEPILYP